jgi:hypothetical protein
MGRPRHSFFEPTRFWSPGRAAKSRELLLEADRPEIRARASRSHPSSRLWALKPRQLELKLTPKPTARRRLNPGNRVPHVLQIRHLQASRSFCKLIARRGRE